MLKPKRKILKKELKKDPVLEKISQAEHFIRTKTKLISYLTVGILAVVLLAFLMIRSKIKANREATGRLGIAELALANQDLDNAIFQFRDIIDKYPGTESAGMATLLLAQAYMDQAEYANSKEFFQNYLDEYKGSPLLKSAAYNGLGVCYEREADPASAAIHFEKGGRLSPYRFQQHECWLNAARNYLEIGELDKARQLLNAIVEDEPAHSVQNESEILLAQIKMQQS